MSPPLSHFLRILRGVAWQPSRKKLGERAGVRGSLQPADVYESPLIRPNGHLLPRGGEGTAFTQKKLIKRQLRCIQLFKHGAVQLAKPETL